MLTLLALARMLTPDAIADVAYRIYAAKGLPGLSMRNVANRIGVTATALYRHFDGKDALIEAVSERGFHLFAAKLLRKPVARDSRRRVLQILDRYRDFAFRQPELFRLMFATPRRRLRRFPADFSAHRSPVFDDLRHAVERGQAESVIRRGGSLEIALDLWAHAHGLLSLYQVGRFGERPRSFAGLYRRSLDRFLRGLRP